MVALSATWGFGALRGFAFFSLLGLAAYAALTSGFSGLGSVYDAIFAWIALQVGYLLAVFVYVAWPRLLQPADPKTRIEPNNKQEQSDQTTRGTSTRDPAQPRAR